MKELRIIYQSVIIILMATLVPAYIEADSVSIQGQIQEEKNILRDIKIELFKEPKDDRGTDVKNIYEIRIENPHGPKEAGRYTIIYYLDGRPNEVFKNQALPFSFKRNFKGQAPGRHDIKIEIEGDNEEILATDTASIFVP